MNKLKFLDALIVLLFLAGALYYLNHRWPNLLPSILNAWQVVEAESEHERP